MHCKDDTKTFENSTAQQFLLCSVSVRFCIPIFGRHIYNHFLIEYAHPPAYSVVLTPKPLYTGSPEKNHQ